MGGGWEGDVVALLMPVAAWLERRHYGRGRRQDHCARADLMSSARIWWEPLGASLVLSTTAALARSLRRPPTWPTNLKL